MTWRQVFPGTWAVSEAVFSNALPGKLVVEAMLGHTGNSYSFTGSVTIKGFPESIAEATVAGVTSVVNEPFVPTGTTGQLQIAGSNVTSGATITALKRRDWRGNFTLSASSRTNLEPNSNNWNITGAPGWTYNDCSVTTGKADPSGGTGAFRVIPNAVSSSYHGPERTNAVGGAGTFTTTLYARAAGYSYIRFADWADGAFDSRISLIDGTVYNGSGITTTALYAGDGWWKITATGVNTTGRKIVVFVMMDSTQTAFAGDGVSGVDLFHCQTESGSTGTALIVNATGASKSVTDYSVTGAGVVTLGESATGTYTWDGSGTVSSGNATATPSPVSGAGAVASIAATGNGTGSPSAVSGAGGLGSYAAKGDANKTITAVSGTGALGSYGAGGGSGPAAVSGAGGVASITATGNATATPSAVSGVGGLGGYSADGGAASVDGTANPSAVTGAGGLGSYAASGGGTGAPAAVSGTGGVATPSVTGGASATPTAVSGTGNVQSSASGGATASIAPVSGAGGLGSYSADGTAQQDGTATPQPVAGVGGLGAYAAYAQPEVLGYRSPAGLSPGRNLLVEWVGNEDKPEPEESFPSEPFKTALKAGTIRIAGQAISANGRVIPPILKAAEKFRLKPGFVGGKSSAKVEGRVKLIDHELEQLSIGIALSMLLTEDD